MNTAIYRKVTTKPSVTTPKCIETPEGKQGSNTKHLSGTNSVSFITQCHMYKKLIIVVAVFVQWPLPLNPAAVFVSEWVQSFYYTELLGFLMYKALFPHLIFCL
jgi:hypothetical protein